MEWPQGPTSVMSEIQIGFGLLTSCMSVASTKRLKFLKPSAPPYCAARRDDESVLSTRQLLAEQGGSCFDISRSDALTGISIDANSGPWGWNLQVKSELKNRLGKLPENRIPADIKISRFSKCGRKRTCGLCLTPSSPTCSPTTFTNNISIFFTDSDTPSLSKAYTTLSSFTVVPSTDTLRLKIWEKAVRFLRTESDSKLKSFLCGSSKRRMYLQPFKIVKGYRYYGVVDREFIGHGVGFRSHPRRILDHLQDADSAVFVTWIC
ncbi:hypothetical protein L218DRAFT_944709 [Marasmius fiardii PR-910]|nr:hypothetical protein L218DRAFT_944709 [Marasmius fiardii PR-910]